METNLGHIESLRWVVCAAMHAALFAALAFASVADIRTRLVPRCALYVSLAAWTGGTTFALVVGASPFVGAGGDVGADILARIAGGVATGGFALLCSLVLGGRGKPPPLGGGDVKLLCIVGLYLGVGRGIAALGLACALALAAHIPRAIAACALSKRPDATFPFVPFIACAVFALCIVSP